MCFSAALISILRRLSSIPSLLVEEEDEDAIFDVEAICRQCMFGWCLWIYSNENDDGAKRALPQAVVRQATVRKAFRVNFTVIIERRQSRHYGLTSWTKKGCSLRVNLRRATLDPEGEGVNATNLCH